MQSKVIVANSSHAKYSCAICKMIDEAAQKRGTGIAKRDPNYIRQKIEEGSAVIALNNNTIVGFCYIESWGDKNLS